MTFEAVRYFRMLNTGDTLRDHVEVAHIMTRRCTVALRTVHGHWRRMPILRDVPGRCGVAGCAAGSEECAVRILIGVTGCTVKSKFV